MVISDINGKPINARNSSQEEIIQQSASNDIVFALWPAGTGKTYIAVALAARALKQKEVEKIILTRPAVEAGESLWFLPGGLQDKVDPYLRPLYDTLSDIFPSGKLQHFMKNRVIEVAPLAFMRGRTLDNAFVVMDEWQNTTVSQMRMFLTRLWPDAKTIIAGDSDQIDYPINEATSWLVSACKVLKDVDGISFVQMSADDVLRHRLVKEIIKAYDQD